MTRTIVAAVTIGLLATAVLLGLRYDFPLPSTSTANLPQSDSTTSVEPTSSFPQSDPLPENVLIAPRDVEGNVDLWLIDVDLGAVGTQLTSAQALDVAPSLSPDRRSIAYLRDDGGTGTIRIMAADGTGDRSFFQPDLGDCLQPGSPSWNPQNSEVVAMSCEDENGTRSMQLRSSTDGAALVTLEPNVDNFGEPFFSPDGQILVYWGSKEDDATDGLLYSLPVDESREGRPLDQLGHAQDKSPHWSPDGTRLAVQRRIGTNKGIRADVEIFLMNSDGSNDTPLTNSPVPVTGPAWSPDGSRIVFLSRGEGEPDELRPRQLWIVNADGTGKPEALLTDDTADTYPPEWGRPIDK